MWTFIGYNVQPENNVFSNVTAERIVGVFGSSSNTVATNISVSSLPFGQRVYASVIRNDKTGFYITTSSGVYYIANSPAPTAVNLNTSITQTYRAAIFGNDLYVSTMGSVYQNNG